MSAKNPTVPRTCIRSNIEVLHQTQVRCGTLLTGAQFALDGTVRLIGDNAVEHGPENEVEQHLHTRVQ